MKDDLQILLVEDSISYAQGMKLLLKQHPNVSVVYHTTDYETTFEILKSNLIEVVILDLNFETKEFDGFKIAKKIKQQYPKIKIMVLSQHTRKQYYERLFDECHVDAYLDKQLGIEETYTALETVIGGGIYIDTNIAQMLEIEQWMHISKREREVLELLVKGFTQKEIADQLFIAPKTVEVHLRNLFERFGVKNSVELVVKYVKYKTANRENIEDSMPPFQL
jgi:DNA-binding NarL/FixJ family response regulator